MSYILSFDCSLPQASLALVKKEEKAFKLLKEKNWESKARPFTHSDRLLLEISDMIKEAGLKLANLNALTVGSGPGRFTGLRTAFCVAKSLSYSLNIPIYPVNSLKALSQNFSFSPVYVSIYAFKNKIYWGDFNNSKETLSLLNFKEWEDKISSFKTPNHLISDIEDFFEIKKKIKEKIQFKKPKISAFKLAQIADNRAVKNWKDIKPNYFRSPVA